MANFSLAPNLERLILEGCASLVDIHESIGNLKRLVYLNMKDCKKIRNLPKNLFMVKVLGTLIVSGCSNLNEFPAELKKMASLKVLDVAEIPFTQLMTTTREVKSCLRRNPEIFWASLPCGLTHLKLTSCNLSHDAFPKDFGYLPSLELLDVSNNPICCLPDCFRGLMGLNGLIFSNCESLKSLDGLPRVRNLCVSSCGLLEKITFQSSSCIPRELLCYFNPNLVEIEYSYKFEPIGRFDVEMINCLGLCNMESGETIQMICAYGSTSIYEVEMYPIQVRHSLYMYPCTHSLTHTSIHKYITHL